MVGTTLDGASSPPPHDDTNRRNKRARPSGGLQGAHRSIAPASEDRPLYSAEIRVWRGRAQDNGLLAPAIQGFPRVSRRTWGLRASILPTRNTPVRDAAPRKGSLRRQYAQGPGGGRLADGVPGRHGRLRLWRQVPRDRTRSPLAASEGRRPEGGDPDVHGSEERAPGGDQGAGTRVRSQARGPQGPRRRGP